MPSTVYLSKEKRKFVFVHGGCGCDKCLRLGGVSSLQKEGLIQGASHIEPHTGPKQISAVLKQHGSSKIHRILFTLFYKSSHCCRSCYTVIYIKFSGYLQMEIAAAASSCNTLWQHEALLQKMSADIITCC